jgi:hypothetical protein
MKYGLVICPSCGKARGVETAKKTTTCPCGRQGRLFKSQIKFETDSPLELAEVVAQANSQLANGKKFRRPRSKPPKDPYARTAGRAKGLRDQTEMAEAIARGLTEELGDFSVEDLGKVLSLLGKGSPDEMIVRLKDSNIVFEVGEGRSRSV